MKPSLRTLAASVIALAATPACVNLNLDGRTRGDLGHVELGYVGGGLDCLFGCGMGMPLLRGTSQIVRIESVSQAAPDDLPALTPVSDDPAVLAVASSASQESGQAFSASGLGTGSARIRLLDPEGNVFDSTTMRVEAAASLSVDADVFPPQGSSDSDQSFRDVSSVDLVVGSDAVLSVIVADAQDEGLAAWGASSLSIDDPTIAELDTFFGTTVTGKAKGTTTLRVTAQDLTRAIPITVH